MISPRIYPIKQTKKYFTRKSKKLLLRMMQFIIALQVMDKVIRFSHQFDNEELCEPIVKVIEGLQDLQILRRRQTKITTFFTNK